MKKFFIISLFMVSFSLTACNNSPMASEDDNSSTSLSNGTSEASNNNDYLGSSYENSIVVVETDPILGVQWEYTWLEQNACTANEGYKGLQLQSLQSNNGSNYDVMKVNCNDGSVIDYYFLIDSFFGNY